MRVCIIDWDCSSAGWNVAEVSSPGLLSFAGQRNVLEHVRLLGGVCASRRSHREAHGMLHRYGTQLCGTIADPVGAMGFLSTHTWDGSVVHHSLGPELLRAGRAAGLLALYVLRALLLRVVPVLSLVCTLPRVRALACRSPSALACAGGGLAVIGLMMVGPPSGFRHGDEVS